MTAYWLVKTEPETYSFADLQREGRGVWDGVRNYAAAGHLKAMKVGDIVLVYHSGAEKAVVGTATVAREAFPDKSDPTGRFVAVEIDGAKPVGQPVTLAQMKADPTLAGMVMVRQGRLSVSPVTADEWAEIQRLTR